MKQQPLPSDLNVATVVSLNRAALVEYWLTLYGNEPPSRTHSSLLRQAIGWQVQAQALGGINHTCRKMLAYGTSHTVLSPGTRLIRQWHGITHQVSVVSNGFDYAGKTYRSLSAIARVITGTQWNGLIFFGVKR